MFCLGTFYDKKVQTEKDIFVFCTFAHCFMKI